MTGLGKGVFVDRRWGGGEGRAVGEWPCLLGPDLKVYLRSLHRSMGEQGDELRAKGGDFSLRKLGPTEPEIGCYYQTLMAPDKG